MRPYLIPITSVALLLSGCHVHNSESSVERPLQTRHEKVARDKSEQTRAEFKIGAGELRITGGTKELMEGDFSFRDEGMAPQVRYNNSSFRSVLQVEQHPTNSHTGNGDSKWVVKLNDEVPMDVAVTIGAGQSDLELGKLNLRSVEVTVGAGQVNLDLRGEPQHDYDVQVRGGVGEVTIRVPRTVRVSADAKGGIGNIEVRGFQQRDGGYDNDAPKDAKTRIHLDVKGGIGQIRLISE